jgi:DNA-binding phage protein
MGMTDVDSILARIRAGLTGHGRKSKVSRETGIHVVQLGRAAKPGWNPKADTLKRVDAAVCKLFPADPPAPPHRRT